MYYIQYEIWKYIYEITLDKRYLNAGPMWELKANDVHGSGRYLAGETLVQRIYFDTYLLHNSIKTQSVKRKVSARLFRVDQGY